MYYIFNFFINIEKTSLPNATQTYYPHNAQNVENIWIIVSPESIRIDTGNKDRSGSQAYITIEYTKTTD